MPVPAGEGNVAGALRDSLCLLQKLPLRQPFRHRPAGGGGEPRRSRAVRAALRQAFDDIELHPLSTTEEYEAMLDEALAGYGRFLQLLRAGRAGRGDCRLWRIPAAVRAARGPFGVSGVNEQLEQLLNRKRAIALPRHSRWYEGRPVMISATTARWGCLTAISALRWKGRGPARLVPDAGRQHEVGAASRLPEHEPPGR
jgi:exodeoxyribonuclease V alpha subunit